MSITDELAKLADLRRQGHLTDQEFADAKRQLLLQGDADAQAAAKSPGEGLTDGAISMVEKTFQSSRWTSGNLFFPDALILADDGIVYRKGSLVGSTEEHINYSAIASFRISNGILFSNVTIETSGGSQPIFVNGLWKAAAKEIQETIRAFQKRG